MHITHRWLAFASATLLTGCGGLAPQRELEITVLGPPSDTVSTSYRDITQAVWLGGHRWATIAPTNDAVALVDFAAHTAVPLGQQGAIRNPSVLFVAADTLYVGDWGLRQLTLWTMDGSPVRSISAAGLIRGALPHARDGMGRFYVELTAAGGVGTRDSAAIVRTGASLDTGDTIARLTPLDVKEMSGPQGRRFERRVFSGDDEWGVLADGSVWVARVHHNRVDWRLPDGKWTKGGALPDRVLEVTRYDREMFVRKFPPELRSMAQQLPFAPIKAPFEKAFSDPDGHIWLVKSRAPIDSAGRYHMVGRDGKLRRNISITGRGRVVGASRDAVIVVEPSATGARLLRVALPPLEVTPAR